MARFAGMLLKLMNAMNGINHSVADPLQSNLGSSGAGILG